MSETVFNLSIPNPHQQFVHIELLLHDISGDVELFLPTWRPGRYEEANFAKQIKAVKVYNENNQAISCDKTSKHTWLIASGASKSLRIQYQFYAAELNAGSTYVSESMLYVNPVNCLMYSKDSFENSVQVNLNLPSDWKIACSLKSKNASLYASSFEELFDSPFICSADLKHKSYEIDDIKFTVWFNDLENINWSRLIKDFEKFSRKQIEDFGEFPVDEFHFLIHTPPYSVYHGVEHLKSTVIALGPKYDVFGKLYNELLGVSSHELYHVWNVKSIRPRAMKPYDFGNENYSKLGYVYEGVTTYMGDLYLLKSGVFSLDDYLKELEKQFQKHFDNPGRFNHSVGESSFDTWLDGYVKGAPGRKVSIYVEGCLLAFACDYMLRNATKDKVGLEGVIKRMYYHPEIAEKGYDEEIYKEILENSSSVSFQSFFDNYINGTHSYEGILIEALDYFGLEMIQVPSSSYSQSFLGIKTQLINNKTVITDLFPGSPADMGGLCLGDEILGVNQIQIDQNLDKWLHYLDSANIILTISRKQMILDKKIPTVNRTFYQKIRIKVKSEPSKKELKARQSWACMSDL